MEEALQKFVFMGVNEVRIVMQNEEPWFVVMDVCKTLDIRTSTVRQIVGDKRVMEVNVNSIDIWNGHGKAPLLVNESGLYKLIMKSRKPNAEAFQDWVTDEVLPSIRKHGAYMTESVANKVLKDPDYIYELAQALVEERKQRKLSDEKAEQYRKERGRISTSREAKVMQKLGQEKRKRQKAEAKADKLDEWIEHIRDGRWGHKTEDQRQLKLSLD